MDEVIEVAIDELSLQQLEDRKVELVEKLEKIDAQLGDPNRIDPVTQQRLTGHEWADWRNRAKGAKRHVLKELRQVNQRIKELKGADEENLSQRLTRIEAKLDELLTHLQDEEVVDPLVQSILDAIKKVDMERPVEIGGGFILDKR